MNKVSFTWLTNHSCNYRCPYCFSDGKWDEVTKNDKQFSAKNILDAWKRIQTKYGDCYIYISGGEPTLFPGLLSLVGEISKMHTVSICTNLSLDVKEIIDNIDSHRVDLSVGFHPDFAQVDGMLDKLNLLRQYHWRTKIMCVGWPPLIPRLNNYYSLFCGFDFSVLPFWGKYNGKAYPQDYTEEEKNVIDKFIAQRENKSFKTEPPKVTGRLCRAGEVYALVQSDGRVLRCCSSNKGIHKNFYADNFSLLNKPEVCSAEYCSCLEWSVC
jgi:MoaA/NifB/PqqE/SkfB family radical SAM enzyme